MADTAEMRRLMVHAADLLDACDLAENAEEAVQVAHSSEVRAVIVRQAAQTAVAMGTASTVLRMVAAAMADDD